MHYVQIFSLDVTQLFHSPLARQNERLEPVQLCPVMHPAVTPPQLGFVNKKIVVLQKIIFQRNRPRHDSVADLMRQDMLAGVRAEVDPNSPTGLKNARDFGHRRIW